MLEMYYTSKIHVRRHVYMNYNNCMYGCSPFMTAPIQCETPIFNDALSDMLIAYAYVPYQRAGKLYCESEALKNGTVFPELNKPLGVYGRDFCSKQN